MEFILSQITGIIALIFVCISYFCKNKSKFLILQIFADIFYASSYLFINVYVAGIITIISSIRCIAFFICEKVKKPKLSYYLLPMFLICYVIVTIIFWQGFGDIIPLITCTLFTISYIQNNTQAIRYLTLIPNAILIVYNIFTTTYTNALLDTLETIVVIVAIIKFHKSKNSAQLKPQDQV